MKKILFSICLYFITAYASAQLTSTEGKSYLFPGIDYVFVFNGITPSTEITYTGTVTGLTDIKWYKFTDQTTAISNQTYISPDDATGYILVVDGKQVATFWAIDYQKYLATLNSIEPEANPGSQCYNVNLNVNATVPSLSYQTPDGTAHNIPRNFSIKYQTLKWDDTKAGWSQVDTIISPVILPATVKAVPAPFCNTTYTLSGDQYAADLGVTIPTVSSSSYTPTAVICHLTTSVTSRYHDPNNELMAPSHSTPINFSAPIDIQFLSNPNEPVTQHYSWQIFKDNSLTSLISLRNEKDTPYTFTQAGVYLVKVTVSDDAKCTYSDSITVTVSESQIQAPNVFTPNGDDINDEFRVAYKSIISFEAWVYNRWGRLVYHWTDPTKGWDGNINGRKASEGAYFYVIKALGSDFKADSKPDPKTHKRVGEYLLKGDINLLRGN